MDKLINKMPIYKVIYNTIAEKIHNSIYKVGDALPSESELEKMFQASRTPVRQALNKLESDGLIYRSQGRGSFVANFKPIGHWTTMTGFKHKYMKDWKKISARTIEVTKTVSPYYASVLEINSQEEMIHLKRIRMDNGEPVIYLEHYLPPHLSIEMFQKDPTFISIDQLFKDEKDIEFTTINEELEAILADTYLAKHLQINEGYPILKSTRISFDHQSNPIDVTVIYLRSEKWKYAIEFNKVMQ
ncbi:GntR family transcriptional regulator [Cytobacillus depressus]|uniref:GntR family transcriptional regulator n=1 Tax=Cytobacillus depressus TaxID=1602942 RepID=A0A6L3V4K4_9BACI|nr:GntR family transcriptional regulator [Cytobacillus depressus]KAB2329762.1 GntR family transcriptional regulator [Cytobacillus depressus]